MADTLTKNLPGEVVCLCGDIRSNLDDCKHQSFPLPIELCHCDSCRHSSGALAGAFVELTKAPSRDILDALVGYESSAKVCRYFCGRCGSHLWLKGWADEFDDGTHNIIWFLWAGGIQRSISDHEDDSCGLNSREDDLLQAAMHAFLTDTVDGGLVSRMLTIARQAEKESTLVGEDSTAQQGVLKTVYPGIWGGPTASLDEIEQIIQQQKSSKKSGNSNDDSVVQEKLLAKCHCGKIAFYITRPGSRSQYDDDTRYYIQGDDAENPKYLSRLCTCESCRKAGGNPLHGWTYVPPQHIVTVSDGQPVEFPSSSSSGSVNETQLPGLKRYKSSEKVTWSFCGTCGAQVFYESADRAWVVDVAVGILRSDAGSLAEDFLSWDWEDVSYSKEVGSRALLASVTGVAG